MTGKATCPDCGAVMERWPTGFRCPWITGLRWRKLENDETVFLACGRPYKRTGQFGPTGGHR